MAGGGPPSASSDFAISEFMAKVDARGSLARRNRYTVEVTPPTSMLGAAGVESVFPDDVEFLVKSVSVPSRTFGTTNFRYGGKYAMEIPYETTQEGVTLTFQETNKFNARKFWYTI